tara:strand:+ start:342 stop:1406 length:1065 start_codon:yes stop_codon:yes gene_type:complete
MENAPSDQWFTLRWRDDALELIDQRFLPRREEYLRLKTADAVAEAIEKLVVRGAPAIGCAAAFGLVLAAKRSESLNPESFKKDLELSRKRLAQTRPTAVNLFWALERMSLIWNDKANWNLDREFIEESLLNEALEIQREDLDSCRKIGMHGVDLIPSSARVLTHCNAGGLATSGYGTALGVVRAAHSAGKIQMVLADETRPFLQGARLTAWELQRDAIPVTVITDGMAAHLMKTGEVDLVVVGADRIAKNGDVANKIGTYGLAVLARHHGIPMCVAAPRSTIDVKMATGAEIPIEERGRNEVASPFGETILPDGVAVRHPAFDVSPADLISAIVTEVGVARPPYEDSLEALMAK